MRQLKKDLKKFANKEKAKLLQGFFKTGKGQYGEGDIFLGIIVPISRQIAKSATPRLELKDVQILLDSKIHEERLIALFILIEKYKSAKKIKNTDEQKNIFNFYLFNAKKGNINNWDLIDLSAPNIVGHFLSDKKNRKILYEFAKSENVWQKRIAILSTFWFMKNNEFQDTLKISDILLQDKHDLIQKAVGWMLREVGKRNLQVEKDFLGRGIHARYKKMPRTMLRYSIEKFPEDERKKYLRGEI